METLQMSEICVTLEDLFFYYAILLFLTVTNN